MQRLLNGLTSYERNQQEIHRGLGDTKYTVVFTGTQTPFSHVFNSSSLRVS
jgi:hypothetical protein